LEERQDGMASEVRERMVDGAMALLARRGLHATSFSEVLAYTGAPRGSLYHHFPEGKDQMVGSAIDRAGAYLLGALERKAGGPAVLVTEHFLAIWRAVLAQTNCEAGCAVLAVTVASDSPALIDHAVAVFRSWRARLAEMLTEGGMAAPGAKAFATTLIAAAEGAVVLSRAERSLEPFEEVAAYLLEQARAMVPPTDPPAPA
jgi:AcrR family transcriptional regulator